MDLEDIFNGGHRRKHDHNDKHAYQRRDNDRHDRDHHSDHHDEDGYETARREHRSHRGHHERGDVLRRLAQFSGTVPHFKWIAAIVGVGLVVVVIVGGAAAIMLFPVVARALGFAYQNGMQGAVESVIPPGGVKGAIESVIPAGGVKGAIESVVPATGVKGIVDSIVSFLQSIWYGKAA
jgi:hypothetical protein